VHKILKHLVVAVVMLYPILLTLLAGAVLLDVVYSHILDDVLETSRLTSVYSDVSDLLLQMGFIVVLSGFAAIALAWYNSAARMLFIASLLILIGFAFLAPAIVLPLLDQFQATHSIGPWIRILIHFAAVALGFQGLLSYLQPAVTEQSSAAMQIPL
jgi:hypothetical protein